jgi:hypothetical protein
MNQAQVSVSPRSGADDKKKGRYGDPVLNLENTFIEIDGVEYQVVDLLRLVVENLKGKTHEERGDDSSVA